MAVDQVWFYSPEVVSHHFHMVRCSSNPRGKSENSAALKCKCQDRKSPLESLLRTLCSCVLISIYRLKPSYKPAWASQSLRLDCFHRFHRISLQTNSRSSWNPLSAHVTEALTFFHANNPNQTSVKNKLIEVKPCLTPARLVTVPRDGKPLPLQRMNEFYRRSVNTAHNLTSLLYETHGCVPACVWSSLCASLGPTRRAPLPGDPPDAFHCSS